MKSFVTHTTTQPTVESLTDYYPFGMAMPGRSYNATAYRFGYTGHEKEGDLAEGVYTTQYRLLDTRLGRWMSVDPLFGKYADMGAYGYCHSNPIVLADPDGRDEYEVNPKGYLTKVKETQSHILYATDEKGNRTNMKLNIHDNSVVEDLMRKRDDYKGSNAKDANPQSGNYAFSKNSETLKLFVFLSDVSSESEWSIQIYKDGNKGIFTTHQPDAVTEYKGRYKLTDIVFDIHSHPGYGGEGTKGASGYDAGGLLVGDKKYIKGRFERWKNIYKDDQENRKKFPFHYVYHRKSQVLYQYTPSIGNINLGKVISYNLLDNIKNSKNPLYK